MTATPRQAVLADPHPVWLDAIAEVLDGGGVEIVAKVSPGPEVLTMLREIGPDLLITEVVNREGALDAPAYIRDVRACSPSTHIVVLAAAADVEVIHDVLLAGANAYVVKTAPPEDLLAAVRQAFDGSVFMATAEVLADLPASPDEVAASDGKLAELTQREVEILKLVADGLTNAQLARILWLSEQTVKFHLSNVYRKLGVANRTEASRWAQKHGVVSG